MNPVLKLEISSILSKCVNKRGHFKSRLASEDSLAFDIVAKKFAECLTDEMRAAFNDGTFSAKCHWLKTLNRDHPSPCAICAAPTKISQDGFTRKYCSVKCRSLDPEWLQKREETCQIKYGKTNAFNAGQLKRTATNLIRYGSEHSISAESTREKALATMQHRYGVDNISQLDRVKNAKAALRMRNFLEDVSAEKQIRPLFDINDYNGVRNNQRLEWECNKCETSFFCNFEQYRPHCPKCEPKKSTRTLQGKFYALLHDEHGLDCKFNSRSLIYPLEIDISFPSEKLAIEINGFYWHSINDRTEEKRQLMKDKGWRFMMFFEDEIRNKPEIVASMITHKLNKTPNRILARHCTVEVIEKATAKHLTAKWHLSGYVPGSTAVGLMHQEVCVAVAIFGKKRFGKRDSGVELLRFCTKPFTAIPGGHSKLIKFFKQLSGVEEIITYADRRLDPTVPVNASEQKQGFTVWDNLLKRRVHRLAISKAKLRNIITEIDMSKTQEELAAQAGFLKVNNLGVFKYVI